EAVDLCSPPVESEWQVLDEEQGRLVGVRVARSAQLHSLYDGRVLVRSGDENRVLSGEEISRLANTKTAGDFEEEAVAGTTRQDLDEAIIDEYLEKRSARGAARVARIDQLLFEIGATNREGTPTVAG